MRTPLLLLASSLAAAALAAGAGAAKLPAPPSLPAGWSHASINVVVRKVPHTYTYDHGRVVAVTSSLLTLREPDGSMAEIAIAPSTIVRISGRAATIDQVQPARGRDDRDRGRRAGRAREGDGSPGSAGVDPSRRAVSPA